MAKQTKRPTDREAERMLLSSLMRGGHEIRTQTTDRLSPTMFFECEDLAATIFGLLEDEKRPDATTVRSYHHDEELVEEIASIRCTPKNALGTGGFIERVEKAFRAVQILQAGQSAVDAVIGHADDPENVQRTLEQSLMETDRQLAAGGTFHVGDVTEEAEREILEFQQQGGVPGLETGLPDLDQITYGWEEDDCVLLAARPSQGKTALAITMFGHHGLKADVPAAYFGLEGSTKALTARLIQAYARVSREENIRSKERTRIHETVNRINDAPLFINDTPGLNVTQIRANLRRLIYDRNVQVAYVDYLQLLRPDPAREYDKKSDRMTGMVRYLKNTARALGIPIIILSQLNRKVEQRNPPKPVLADLREGGEEPADKVVQLWRPASYGINRLDDGSDSGGMGEVLVRKHRDGPTGQTYLAFLKTWTRWAPAARRGEHNEPNDDAPF